MSTFLICLALVVGGAAIGGLLLWGLILLAIYAAIGRGLNW